jgi:phospholipid/cholesterol/gamma-HCH transport system substrate-binding protein
VPIAVFGDPAADAALFDREVSGMQYRKNEIRAGAFILISFVIMVVLLFSVSDLQGIFKKRKEYKVLFLSNDGLEKNANVRISGIRIGRVSGMRVVPELGNKVELTLDVFEDAVIKEDVKASIKTLGLVGKKYVDISGGTSNARQLRPGAVLYGEESLKMEDLTRMAMEVVDKLKGVAQNIEKIVQNVERTVGDPALAKNIKGAVLNVNEITENVKVMTSSKDEVAQTLRNLPDLLKKVDASVENLKEITEKTDKLVGENRKNVDATMDNVKEITNNLKEMTEDVKKHPWKLIRKP